MSLNVSFCTTCRGRLDDLKLTLPVNFRLLSENDELVLLSYNCPATTGWVKANYRNELEYGRLRLYTEQSADRFFMAKAKNIAHLLGRGDWLVNLDADNYLDDQYLSHLNYFTQHRPPSAMLYPYQGSGGFKGRVAVRNSVFKFMGGYDEHFNLGYGYEECDLYRRWKKRGLAIDTVVIDPMTVIVTSEEQKAAGQVDKISLSGSNATHRQICEDNLRNRRLIANSGTRWGVSTLEMFDGTIVKTGYG